jgi:hypothetical protein
MLCTGASPQRCSVDNEPSDFTSFKDGTIYLIVEAALFVEVVEEFGIGLASPKIHVTDLEVTPD